MSYIQPTDDLSSLTDFPSCAWFLNNNISENEKNGTVYGPVLRIDNGASILEFPANLTLKYKRIISAKLTYTINMAGDTWYWTDNKAYLHSSYFGAFRERLAVYKSDDSLSQINIENYKTRGTVSEQKVKDIDLGLYAYFLDTYTRETDITDLYKSNAGNVFRLIISIGDELPDPKSSRMGTVYQIASCARGYNYVDGEIRGEIRRQIPKSSASILITYEDVTQPAPTPTYPINTSIIENTDIQFSWSYNSETQAEQKSATVSYRAKNGNWTTVTNQSSSKHWTLQNGLPRGSYEWKVSVTNIVDESSVYSDVQEFTVIGKPASPIIQTPNNCCLTTITWNAADQEAFELMLYKEDALLVHEIVATTASEYKPQFFMKGNYSVKVRIKNNTDMWSDFGYLAFTIDAAGPTKGTLRTIPFDNYVNLEGYSSEATNMAIIRKSGGKETIISTTSIVTDDTVAGGIDYEYVLRSWNTGGYTDSDPKLLRFEFDGSIIKSDNYELHLKISEDKFLRHNESISRNMSVMNFVGREYPVIERGEFTTRTISKRFYVSREEKPILDEMSKEPAVFYRDSRGNAFKAVITELQYNEYMSDGYIADMTLLKTAPNEVIINV